MFLTGLLEQLFLPFLGTMSTEIIVTLILNMTNRKEK